MPGRAFRAFKADEKVALATARVECCLAEKDQGVARVTELHVDLVLLRVATALHPDLTSFNEARISPD